MAQAVRILRPLLDSPEERFAALFLDLRARVIGWAAFEAGSVADVGVSPAGVYRRALLASAAGVLVAHNHPSGDPVPSCGDRALTRTLARAGAVLGIGLTDHLIVAGARVYSFHDAGHLGGRWRACRPAADQGGAGRACWIPENCATFPVWTERRAGRGCLGRIPGTSLTTP